MSGRHEIERLRGGAHLQKARKGRVIALAVLFLVFIAGVAWALFMLLGGITGSVDKGQWALVLDGGAQPVTVTDGTCTAVRATGGGGPGQVDGILDIDWVGVSDLDECTVTLAFHPSAGLTNSTDLRLQQVVVPTGLEASLNGSCGATVTPAMTAATAPLITVTFIVEAGAPTSILLDGSSFEWVRSADFSAGLC